MTVVARKREKNSFYLMHEDGGHFAILATEANPSVFPIHEWMRLVLEREEIEERILNGRRTGELSRKVPCFLKR